MRRALGSNPGASMLLMQSSMLLSSVLGYSQVPCLGACAFGSVAGGKRPGHSPQRHSVSTCIVGARPDSEVFRQASAASFKTQGRGIRRSVSKRPVWIQLGSPSAQARIMVARSDKAARAMVHGGFLGCASERASSRNLLARMASAVSMGTPAPTTTVSAERSAHERSTLRGMTSASTTKLASLGKPPEEEPHAGAGKRPRARLRSLRGGRLQERIPGCAALWLCDSSSYLFPAIIDIALGNKIRRPGIEPGTI